MQAKVGTTERSLFMQLRKLMAGHSSHTVFSQAGRKPDLKGRLSNDLFLNMTRGT